MKKHNIKKNEYYTVTCTDMTNLGAGVARIDGVVVFIPGGVDGDTAEIKIIKSTADYCVGRLERIITPSPHRLESDCPVSHRCGGCVYRNITYAHELELKRAQVAASFRKAGLEAVIAPVLATGEINGWRNKIQLPIGSDGSIGYYANHSHTIIPCTTCPLQLRAFDPLVAAAQNWITAHPGLPLRHLCLRGGSGGIMVCLVASAEFPAAADFAAVLSAAFPEIRSILLNINDRDTNVILGDRWITLFGQDWIEDELLGLTFRISMPSFYQVNHDAAALAYRKLGELAGIRPGDTVLDLYCGTGTIGLCLASAFGADRLTGVEIVPEAVENARENALRNGITNAEFLCGDAADIPAGKADVILVDPPRKGLAPTVIEDIVRSGPDRVAYMSCDHETLARDCAIFARHGYVIGEVTPVDLFPRTGHVETVCLLSKLNAR